MFSNLHFNFILLSFYYSIWLTALPSAVFFCAIWKIFINNNFFYYRIKPTSWDKLTATNPFKKLKYSIFLKWMLSISLFFAATIYNFKLTSGVFFWNHLIVNNFKFWVFFFLVLVSYLLMLYLRFFSLGKTPASIDFFFAIANLTACLPLLYFVNTLYSFIFLIELISTLIFYKFVVSKIWSREMDHLTDSKGRSLERALPKQYMDMLFFQFWATFFSTITLLVTTLTLFYLFNTSDWTTMYYLVSINTEINYLTNSLFFTLLITPLFFGIFLKLGLSPLHLYKIEVYQSIPFKTIFFYTTYFFLTFVIFFCYFLIFLFSYSSIYWCGIISVFFLIGAGYTISLLFDVDFTKAFFAYSSIINVIFSFLLIILFINFN